MYKISIRVLKQILSLTWAKPKHRTYYYNLVSKTKTISGSEQTVK